MRRRLALAAAAAFAVGIAPAAAAQSRLKVVVALPAAGATTTDGPTVTVQNVFADARSGELLSSGFVARLSVAVELWASRTLFDDLLRSVSWHRIVRYDPMSKTYRVARVISDTLLVEEGRYASLDDVRRAMSEPARAPITAPHGRRGLYYTANVTIETFNSDDLAEVQRWLSGDAQPAIRGKKNPASALVRGIRTVFSRLLGGDVKRQEGRSPVFQTGSST